MSGPLPRKTCRDCGASKCIRDFYRHPSYADGREGICKRCKIRAVAENCEMKSDYYREQKRLRSARPENVAKRKAYAQSPRGRAVHRASCRRYLRFKALECAQ